MPNNLFNPNRGQVSMRPRMPRPMPMGGQQLRTRQPGMPSMQGIRSDMARRAFQNGPGRPNQFRAPSNPFRRR